MTSTIVEHLLDAQAVNAAQDRAIYDPSPETDSALEHALLLLKTANDSQRPHAVALVRYPQQVHRLNATEREHERRAAGEADGVGGSISNVHEFVRLVRPLLADLAHPFLGAARAAERRAELRDVLCRTVDRTRSSISVRHLLGVKKFTLLVRETEAWLDAQSSGWGLGLPLTAESLGEVSA